MMNPWSYRDYKNSIEHDVVQGMTQLGFNTDQSIGYANNEILLRLEEYPEENVLALTALAISAYQRGTLSSYASGDELYEELKEAYAKGEHLAMAERIDYTRKQEFLSDVDVVKKTLGMI